MTQRSRDWADYAQRTLAAAGYRSSQPRQVVIDALARRGCSVTAQQVAELVRGSGSGVGLASVYRTLDLLDRMRLVQRFDVGEGAARYEPAYPDGEHHHHMVCATCGVVTAFEDEGLERAIDRLSSHTDFAVAAHDVTLHGQCAACRAGAGAKRS